MVRTVNQIMLGMIDCAFDRQSWHGANLMSSLRTLSAAEASQRVKGRKTIWEQLLHAAYWKQRVLNKLAGKTPFPRSGSNWIEMPKDRSEKSLNADIQMLREIHARLRDAISNMPKKKLDEKTIWLIQGAAAHDVYHAGQIKLLRRLTDSGSRARRSSHRAAKISPL